MSTPQLFSTGELGILEWNLSNADYNLQAAINFLEGSRRTTEAWVEEVKHRRREMDRHLDALVEFKRSHASPTIKL